MAKSSLPPNMAALFAEWLKNCEAAKLCVFRSIVCRGMALPHSVGADVLYGWPDGSADTSVVTPSRASHLWAA